MCRIVIGAPAFPPDKGGASEYFRILYYKLKEYGFDVTVITYGKDRDNDIKGIGIKRWSRFILLNFILSFLITFFKFFRINADIIHVHTTSGLCLALSVIGRLKGIPIIRDVRDLQAPDWILKYPKACAYIVCCRAGADFLREKGISKEKIFFIPPPLEFKIKLNKSEGKVLKLLYVGELTVNKGVTDLLEIIKDIYSKYRCFKLTIVGDGPLRSKVLEASKKFACLEYRGPLDHDKVLELLSESDLLVYPSYSECYPRAVVEALEMGCAVIAYDVGDIKDIVGSAGIVCKPELQILKNVIVELLSNPQKIYELKSKTYKEFRKHPKLDTIMKKLLLVYQKSTKSMTQIISCGPNGVA